MKMLLLWVVLPGCSGDLSWSSVSFSPRHRKNCQATQIALRFAVEGGIQANDVVYLYLGGFTSGDCANEAGSTYSSGDVLLWPRGDWEGAWAEGTVANEYRDSYLTLTAQKGVQKATNYLHTITIDPSNNLRPNCGIVGNSTHIRIAASASNDTAAAMTRRVNVSDAVEGSCYLTDTELSFRPAVPKVPSKIEISFVSAQTLHANDRVAVRLSGWTSGKAFGSPGANIGVGQVELQDGDTLAGNISKYFRGEWREGCCYEQHKAGFVNSTLYLHVRRGVAIIAGTTVNVVVKDGQLRPQCGMPGPYDPAHIRVIVAENTTRSDVPATPIETANAIGDGCARLSSCSGYGKCDHCLNRCDCDVGFGAPFEAAYRQLEDWTCAEFSCPIGPTWGGMPLVDGYAHSRYSECSGAGLCQRKSGTCKCYIGFEGPACERRECPGTSAETGPCSGHGICASMRDLAMIDRALPLSSYENRPYSFTASEFPSHAWDATRLFGCVCDSSWPVGLESGEWNTPEWFGPDCSLRHCPSGNDPLTAVDETDCSNTTTRGGRAVGNNASVCHVDCSNRGLCDYETGLCSCFAGFSGSNCDTIDVLSLGAGGGGGAAAATSSSEDE
ncbi:hypothetical protein CTAYLR_010083 [Chrysophaeum taylorii]|uniref:EGF-like domain-containing protein n=1 Tax=Chrysophaeum taylorii TaxID=2483200 RepID=A0AAD7UAF6_9STRA|nr:hypothetical protein CTAYLR_010083 [Chrysophaeum taylorii]